MPVVKSDPVICNGNSPVKRRKPDAPSSKPLNPNAPELVPRSMVATPPSSGEMAFAEPISRLDQPHPPHMGPFSYNNYLYARPVQEPYSGYAQGAYTQSGRCHSRQTSSIRGEGSVTSSQQAPQTAPVDVPPHESFGINITQEVMAILNHPSRPRSFSETSSYPTMGYQTGKGWHILQV